MMLKVAQDDVETANDDVENGPLSCLKQLTGIPKKLLTMMSKMDHSNV